jgi:hypothetical protein
MTQWRQDAYVSKQPKLSKVTKRKPVLVDLPEDLWRKAKAAAAMVGVPVNVWLAELLRREVA